MRTRAEVGAEASDGVDLATDSIRRFPEDLGSGQIGSDRLSVRHQGTILGCLVVAVPAGVTWSLLVKLIALGPFHSMGAAGKCAHSASGTREQRCLVGTAPLQL